MSKDVSTESKTTKESQNSDALNQSNSKKIKFSKTQSIAILGLLIALTFVGTFINFRLPLLPGNGGLIHLGNVAVIIASIIFGKKYGAISAAFGMGLFDIMSGWAIWAPFTFVIMGIGGYLLGLTYEKLKLKPYIKYILALFVLTLIKVIGYYFAEVILYGNWILPFGSIPGNIAQIVVAGLIDIPIIAKLSKIYK